MFKLFANQIWKFKTLLPNGLVVSMTQECSTTVVYVLSLNEVTSMASYWVIHNGHVRYIFSIWCLASVVVLVLFSWPLSYSSNIQAPRLTPRFSFCARSKIAFFYFQELHISFMLSCLHVQTSCLSCGYVRFCSARRSQSSLNDSRRQLLLILCICNRRL